MVDSNDDAVVVGKRQIRSRSKKCGECSSSAASAIAMVLSSLGLHAALEELAPGGFLAFEYFYLRSPSAWGSIAVALHA